MITKQTLAAAGLRPGELARMVNVEPGTVSRYNPDSPQHINPPGAVKAMVYAWPHLPEDVRAAMLAGKHLE